MLLNDRQERGRIDGLSERCPRPQATMPDRLQRVRVTGHEDHGDRGKVGGLALLFPKLPCAYAGQEEVEEDVGRTRDR